jgi:hypothetical protein
MYELLKSFSVNEMFFLFFLEGKYLISVYMYIWLEYSELTEFQFEGHATTVSPSSSCQ